MNSLTGEILRSQGFEYEANKKVYIKIIDGRIIICYKPNMNINVGYWVCDIWTSYEPVQNNKIVTDGDLQKFIDSCCPDNIIKIAEVPDINKQCIYF